MSNNEQNQLNKSTEDNQSAAEIKTLNSQLLAAEKLNNTLSQKLETSNAQTSPFAKYNIKDVDAAIKFQREAEKKLLEDSGEYEKALEAQRQQYTKAVDAEKEKSEGYRLAFEESITGRALDEAINKAGGKLKPLRAIIAAEHTVKTVEVDGAKVVQVFERGSKTPRTKDKSLTPLTLDDLVLAYRESVDTAGLFAPTGNSGGGARTSTKTINSCGVNNIPTQSYKDFKEKYGNFTEYYKPELL